MIQELGVWHSKSQSVPLKTACSNFILSFAICSPSRLSRKKNSYTNEQEMLLSFTPTR